MPRSLLRCQRTAPRGIKMQPRSRSGYIVVVNSVHEQFLYLLREWEWGWSYGDYKRVKQASPVLLEHPI